MEKVCRDCGEAKPVAEFFRNSRNAGGYSTACKPCYMTRQATYKMRPPKNPPPEGMKRCWACKETKPEAEFSKNKGFHDGLSHTCRACNNARSAAHNKKNRATLAAKALARYHANKDRYADYSLKRHYGLSRGDYDAMLAAQDGRCAICGSTSPNGVRIKRFHVDHCHATGRVRGLLCENCNKGIGLFHDDTDLIHAAINYLDKYSK